MSHQCIIQGSSAVCFEKGNELWVKEYYDGTEREGRTYKVNFCPECGFKKPYPTHPESITRFNQDLPTAISQMNHNIELIKAFMRSQNTHNQCFMERDLATSQEIAYLKRRLEEDEE